MHRRGRRARREYGKENGDDILVEHRKFFPDAGPLAPVRTVDSTGADEKFRRRVRRSKGFFGVDGNAKSTGRQDVDAGEGLCSG